MGRHEGKKDMGDSNVRYSRGGNSNPLGKCTHEVKTSVPEEVKEQLTALAVVHGMTLSEYVREALMKHLYGELHMARLAMRRGEGGSED